jgi:osmotically-inducible protein OsmY
MTQKGWFRSSCSIVLPVAILASMAILLESCNTEQSPHSQFSDAQITTQVKTKLASDVRASSITNIQVNTTNGIVTLAGQVESAEVRSNAEKVAASVPGVVRVNNNLQVDASAASVR